ncbi:MAG TPA: SDR family oxidoreductase [Rhizomicrobium sp.]|nr:SDR family oxidoreductase [Rhizomicrobium sp.]
MGLLNNRVILITGTSSGIGRASAIRCAAEGAIVVATSRREERGSLLVDEIQSSGGKARFIRADLSDPNSLDELFALVSNDYGRLDGAFNNAGIRGNPHAVADFPVGEFDAVFDTNVRGTWLCMRHEMKMMRQQGHGAIVNTSSIAGLVAVPDSSVYVAAKHAVIGMTKAASLDAAALPIRVNCIAPGVVYSEMLEEWLQGLPEADRDPGKILPIPMKRAGNPEEIASLAVWLLSDETSYMTGAVVVADGGLTVS